MVIQVVYGKSKHNTIFITNIIFLIWLCNYKSSNTLVNKTEYYDYFVYQNNFATYNLYNHILVIKSTNQFLQ